MGKIVLFYAKYFIVLAMQRGCRAKPLLNCYLHKMQTAIYIDYALVFSHFPATSGEEGRKALMREIELGKLFGESEQPNIIKFLGCVTTEGNTLK